MENITIFTEGEVFNKKNSPQKILSDNHNNQWFAVVSHK